EPLVRDNPLGVAAVEVVPREVGGVAEVLAAGRAVAACAVGPPEPRDAEPPSVAGLTHDLVADDQRQLRMRQLAVGHVKGGAADAAGADAQQHLTLPRFRLRNVRRPERRSRPVEHHCPHRRFAAATTLRKSTADVTGPTPPGTGVTSEATGSTAAVSTSPAIP